MREGRKKYVLEDGIGKGISVKENETKSYVRKTYYELSVGQSRRKEALTQNHMKPSGLPQLVNTERE